MFSGFPFCCCATNTATKKDEELVQSRALNPPAEQYEEPSPVSDRYSPQVAELQAEGGSPSTGVRHEATAAGAATGGVEETGLGEKERIQRTVKEVAKEAVSGISMEVVDHEKCTREDVTFVVDKRLKTFTIKDAPNSPDPKGPVTLEFTQLSEIVRGPQVFHRYPLLSEIEHEGFFIILVMKEGAPNSRGSPLILFTPSKELAQKVYLFLKIIKLSGDARARSSAV
uniref:Uncharacterized protein n=1 Tax=Chromera velia CCMP2878 TaxID=1169474 RepID=A0A0G4FQL7_9ALVE|eukprot:Cvel_18102.t1-p1 / transcript=Cvel_18102.t1 / gene=Cvel_18102 / organism=Chromera_velia_CCMP2878 / gene_product=hypothetical protein / transcript_product=hypothetical protein / location=Cvel_scaffold1484:4102-8163(-) / protein_length=226 / sequence_SO=supercontig / SO=protein_coding / is_pseudo=false